MNPSISLMRGTKPSWTSWPAFWGSVTPSYRRTATYIALTYLLHIEGGVISPAVSRNVAKCEGLEGLAQLPRTALRRSSHSGHSAKFNFAFTEFYEVRYPQ